MRTASGIVNNRGRFIAGVVLLTAVTRRRQVFALPGCADAIRIGGIALKPANMPSLARRRARCAQRAFSCGATGALVERRMRIALRFEPRGEPAHLAPGDKSLIQIGRFGFRTISGE